MSTLEDHLRNGTFLEHTSNKTQIDEIMRLASLLAVRRVRKYAVSVGHGPNETEEGTERGVVRATAALRSYLEQIL